MSNDGVLMTGRGDVMRESLNTDRKELLVSEVQDLCLLNNGCHKKVGGEKGPPDNSCRHTQLFTWCHALEIGGRHE